jgi:hypothetical protein
MNLPSAGKPVNGAEYCGIRENHRDYIDSNQIFRDEGQYPRKIYFFQKGANRPEHEGEDCLIRDEIAADPKIHTLIEHFESRALGEPRPFDEVRPRIAGVKKWILEILSDHGYYRESRIEDLIDAFRSHLSTPSRAKDRNIVGVLLLHGALLLVHCKKAPSLVETPEGIITAQQILSSENVLRAAIIKDLDEKLYFSAYEKSARWSMGHARFWGIDPHQVAWDQIGEISLTVEIEGFAVPVQVPLEPSELDELLRTGQIAAGGEIVMGQTQGTITKGRIFRTEMDFHEFYDDYIARKEDLQEHRRTFGELIQTHYAPKLSERFDLIPRTYKYEDDREALFENTPEGRRAIIHKNHPGCRICYVTDRIPRIRPSPAMTDEIYQSIFESKPLALWHAGEETSAEPIAIGSLSVHNRLTMPEGAEACGAALLGLSRGCKDRNARFILQILLCEYWRYHLGCGHFGSLFGHMIDQIKRRGIEGRFEEEDELEFRPKEFVIQKPSTYAIEEIVPAITRQMRQGALHKHGIIYGVENDGSIAPMRTVNGDQIALIEEIVNDRIHRERLHAAVHRVAVQNGALVAVLVFPDLKG